MRPTLTSKTDIETKLSELKNWVLFEDKLFQVFRFKNFTKAFSFITQVAFEAEKLNHHPDWSNSYNTVEITLSTHDVGGLTELDFKLAEKINKIIAYEF
jgi:4a-hydroxytetrahydrobiopterin dehydratase